MNHRTPILALVLGLSFCGLPLTAPADELEDLQVGGSPAQAAEEEATPAPPARGEIVRESKAPDTQPLVPTVSQEKLEAQRRDFLAAEQLLAKFNWAEYQDIKPRLEGYTLLPYLEYGELRWRLEKVDPDEVARFLDNNDGPLARLLRSAWLEQLAGRKQWTTYLRFYEESDSVTRKCHYLQAKMETGHKKEALEETDRLWLSGKSQPDDCSPLFTAWKAAGHQTDEMVWRRIELAMMEKEGGPKFAKFLAKSLPAADRPLVDKWVDLDANPQKLLKADLLPKNHPWTQAILAHGVRRLANKEADKALDAWIELNTRHKFGAEQRRLTEKELGLRLVWQKSIEAYPFLDRVLPGNPDTTLLPVAIRGALQIQDWQRVAAWIDLLPESDAKEDNWRYWKARALAEQGKRKEAEELLKTVAKERTFWGFLAADRVGVPYRLEDIPIRPSAAERARVAHIPPVARAYELAQLGRDVESRREWNHLLAKLPKSDLQIVARLAHEWGWTFQSITALAKAGYWDDMELRFPLHHREQVEARAKEAQVDGSWVFAVMRQESAFVTDARSTAGALGLMQLLPSTAKAVAKRIDAPQPKEQDLLEPDTNIQLGSSYLRQLIDDLGGNRILATAAYNAGPGRVVSWLPDGALAADIWVETIPFKETRSYVQRVLAYTVLYDQRLGAKPRRLKDEMPPIGSSLRASRIESEKLSRGDAVDGKDEG